MEEKQCDVSYTSHEIAFGVTNLSLHSKSISWTKLVYIHQDLHLRAHASER